MAQDAILTTKMCLSCAWLPRRAEGGCHTLTVPVTHTCAQKGAFSHKGDALTTERVLAYLNELLVLVGGHILHQ